MPSLIYISTVTAQILMFSIESLLVSILRQLVEQTRSLTKPKMCCDQNARIRHMTGDELVLRFNSTSPDFGRVCLFIDGLDGCPETDMNELPLSIYFHQ